MKTILVVLEFTSQALSKLENQEYKKMVDKLMYIPNDNTQNNPFCILQLVVSDTHLNEQLIKIHKSPQSC